MLSPLDSVSRTAYLSLFGKFIVEIIFHLSFDLCCMPLAPSWQETVSISLKYVTIRAFQELEPLSFFILPLNVWPNINLSPKLLIQLHLSTYSNVFMCHQEEKLERNILFFISFFLCEEQLLFYPGCNSNFSSDSDALLWQWCFIFLNDIKYINIIPSGHDFPWLLGKWWIRTKHISWSIVRDIFQVTIPRIPAC